MKHVKALLLNIYEYAWRRYVEERGGGGIADWALKKIGHADVIMQAIFYTYDHEKNISRAPSGGKSNILQLSSVHSEQCFKTEGALAFGCGAQTFRTNSIVGAKNVSELLGFFFLLPSLLLNSIIVDQ